MGAVRLEISRMQGAESEGSGGEKRSTYHTY